jgi:hypothetical protein
VTPAGVRLQVLKGKLACRTLSCRELPGPGGSKQGSVTLNGKTVGHKLAFRAGLASFDFDAPLDIAEGEVLQVSLRA